MSPTQRTLKRARELGFLPWVVERWNPHARLRQDMYGCIDILLVRPGIGTIGVQACAGSSHAARRAKSIAEPRLRFWLESGNRFEVWSWSKRGPRGKPKKWELRREEITLAHLPMEAEHVGA